MEVGVVHEGGQQQVVQGQAGRVRAEPKSDRIGHELRRTEKKPTSRAVAGCSRTEFLFFRCAVQFRRERENIVRAGALAL